ncbi:MAG TPA: nicotinate (nicotinamide) nucleotide adenylyltransferase [Acidobacteriota bacterium]|nr:nicotinate (nicotinamide) nucleotide adenylyltransferase [Acidobacteriota bacterium]
MRRGVFGGTFDPPHAGHLQVARRVRDALGLDVVEIVPSNEPPHRRSPVAAAADRLEMVRLLCAGEDRLVPSAREIERGGISYTVLTLREMRAEAPDDELFLVLGADSYDELPGWRASAEIEQLAHVVVLPRPGAAGAAAVREADRPRLRLPGEPPPAGGKALYAVPMPETPEAARQIRALLARGEDPGEALPRPVLAYIRRRGLYAAAPAGDTVR